MDKNKKNLIYLYLMSQNLYLAHKGNKELNIKTVIAIQAKVGKIQKDGIIYSNIV